MVININSSRINIASGGAGKANDRSGRQAGNATTEVIVPKRAHVNIIPAPESLQTLINGAVEAMRKGSYWDRGTMLNLLV